MKPRRRKAEFEHIRGVIADILKNYRRESDEELLQVWHVWEGVVGDVIAQNAKPAAFKGRILIVHTTSSTWVHQLQFLKEEIVGKLNTALGKTLIDDLKFRVGQV